MKEQIAIKDMQVKYCLTNNIVVNYFTKSHQSICWKVRTIIMNCLEALLVEDMNWDRQAKVATRPSS